MASDFSAKQIRVSQLMASGGISGTDAGLLIYSASGATDYIGGFPAALVAGFGDDVFLFVSGTKDGKSTGAGDVTLFGGDVVVSGTMYVEKQVVEVNETTTGSFSVSGSMFVSQSAIINQGLVVNDAGGSHAIDDFRVETGNKTHAVFADASTDQVLILSGGGGGSTDEAGFSDTAFFVSGTVGSRGTAVKGTALFGGDVHISGAITSDGTAIVNGAGIANRVAYWTDTDTLTSDADLTFDGTDLTVSTQSRTGILVDGSADQVLILSGGGVTSKNEAEYSDMALFVSGTVGSKGVTNSKGTTVFGGDVVISGSLYGGSPLAIGDGLTVDGSTVFNEGGIGAADFRVETATEDEAFFIDSSANTIYINKGETAVTTIIASANDEAIRVTQTGVTFNEDGNATNDFRVESDNQMYMLHIDSSHDRVGIGTNTFTSDVTLDVRGDVATSGYVSASMGFSGSLTSLVDGTSYLVAGSSITITSASNGQVTISSGLTPGGSNTQVQYNNNGAFGGISGATTDGSAITFGDTGILVGQYITHTGDANTRIHFDTDEIRLETGGVDYIKAKASETALTLNPDSVSINTLINSNNKLAVSVIGATDQVLILSGGGGNSFNSAAGSDVSFYVSGSATNLLTIPLNLGSSVSNYEGDLVVSGAIRGKNISLLGVNPQASDLILHAEGTNYSFGANHNILGTTSAVISPGGDAFFSVSGSMGGIGAVGTSVFGGDVVVSGSLRARELKITTHKASPGDANSRYMRFDSNGSDQTAGDNNKLVAPYIGTLIKVVARTTSAAGSTVIGLHTNTDGNAQVSNTAAEEITVDISAANTAFTFNFTGAANWGPGDIIALQVNPSQDPGAIILTAVWEFETYTT